MGKTRPTALSRAAGQVAEGSDTGGSAVGRCAGSLPFGFAQGKRLKATKMIDVARTSDSDYLVGTADEQLYRTADRPGHGKR